MLLGLGVEVFAEGVGHFECMRVVCLREIGWYVCMYVVNVVVMMNYLSRGEKGAYISLFDGKKYKGTGWRDVILSMIAAFSRLKAGANGRREWTWEGRVIVRSLVQGV